MWKFLRPVSVVCLVLTILCFAAVVAGQIIYKPDALEMLGLDLCDGDPCFQGIKLGMPWPHTLPSVPSSAENVQYNIGELENHVAQLEFYPTDTYALGTAGMVLEHFGKPCRIALEYSGTVPRPFFDLIYPSLDARIVGQSRFNLVGYDLQVTSPVFGIDIVKHNGAWACDAPQMPDNGDWHGFISTIRYAQYFAKASNSAQR